MSKTFGAIDRKRRHQRSDKGKQRVSYNGRKCKHRKYKFEKVYEKRMYLKLWFFSVESMSYEGYLRWNNRIRHRIHPYIYRPLFRVDAYVYNIDNYDKFLDFCLNMLLRDGEFLIKGFRKTKNKYHATNCKIAKIRITSHDEGLKVHLIKDYSLNRRWFFKK